MWLTLAAMRNAIAVLMASLAIVLLGMTSIDRISIDLFPNINFPQIQVGTVYKGASAQDIERSVTYPLEKAVSAVANVKHVESRSRQGFSLVIVQFNWGTDIDAALTEVVQRINQIINTLPPGVQQPFIIKSDLSNIPVCVVTVSGGGLDERALYDLAYNTIEPQFERLSGVASANVDGGKIRQITINLDRDRLYSKGLSVNEVTKSVNDANFLLPSGDVKVGSFDYNVFTNNQFSVVEPMEDIIVRRTGTTPIRLRDVGRVEDSAETQVSIVRVNGERSVFLRINKQPGANTVEVVDAVRATLPKLLGVPPGVNVNLSFDQSTYIRQSIESLWHEAAVGSILAFLVILVFLRSFVSTIIISIAIPLSLLLTLIAMYFLGQTLNIFTLGGLALAVGRLVDDSIVELENINRHLDMPGKPRRKAVLDAAREVAMPIFVSTITTIVVFLPTVFLEGQARLLFIPLTFTISFSLFASFLVSRTVTPLLCLQWLRSEHEMTEHRGLRGRLDRLFVWSGGIFQRLDAWYQRCLEWSLDHRRALIGGILAMSASAVIIYLTPNAVGTEFFPAGWRTSFAPRPGRERSRPSCHPSGCPAAGRDSFPRTRGRMRPSSRSILATQTKGAGKTSKYSPRWAQSSAGSPPERSLPFSLAASSAASSIRGRSSPSKSSSWVMTCVMPGIPPARSSGASRTCRASPSPSSAGRRTIRSSTSWWTGRRRRWRG